MRAESGHVDTWIAPGIRKTPERQRRDCHRWAQAEVLPGGQDGAAEVGPPGAQRTRELGAKRAELLIVEIKKNTYTLSI